MTTLSLLLVLLSVTLAASWAVSWPLLGAWRWIVSVRPGAARFNILVLNIPLLVGLFLAAGAVWPAHSPSLINLACHCLPGASDGAIHLCLSHPAGALPLLPVAVFLLIWLGWRPVRQAHGIVRRLLATRRLRLNTSWRADPRHGVLLGELGTPNAFTAGLLQATVLVDQGWWRSLSGLEREVIAAHERTHARCRDPLTHAVGWLLAGLAPERLARPLLGGWLAQAEQRADLVAAAAVGDPLVVAELLTRQARSVTVPEVLVPAFSSGGVRARVHALLHPPSYPVHLGSDLGPGLALTAGSLFSVGLFGFHIHGALERLLRLFP